MKYGWHLARSDARDDFVRDPVGYSDFSLDLADRLQHLCEQLKSYRYRPRYLTEVDIPKSGLSVRPGNVLPIEESVILHGIVYLLAPFLDKKLDKKVYSYRLHRDWKRKVQKGEGMFQEDGEEFPFLKEVTIRKIDPLEPWYLAWTEFEKAAARAVIKDGYTHLTKTDISAYFENIDLSILEAQIRSLLKREEDGVIEVLFRILNGWTRTTSTGTPVGRGIPQGNDVSSFLSNLYLCSLDRDLEAFCRRRDAVWYRYVDDAKVFTRSEQDAREAVFAINAALRKLYLNLQGTKTKILSGEALEEEMDDSEVELVSKTWEIIRKRPASCGARWPDSSDAAKGIRHLIEEFVSVGETKRSIDEHSRLFRRILTVIGHMGDDRLEPCAIEALRTLPETRVLQKAVRYLSQLPFSMHSRIANMLLKILDEGLLPFPYQVAMVLESLKNFDLDEPSLASRIRQKFWARNHDWVIRQKALEAIATLPYASRHALALGEDAFNDEHPGVRRAGCLLLTRGPCGHVRERLHEAAYSVDGDVSRLALYFLKHIEHRGFGLETVARLRQGDMGPGRFTVMMGTIACLRCSLDPEVRRQLGELLSKLKPTTARMQWFIRVVQVDIRRQTV